jgi:hypothetical protein
MCDCPSSYCSDCRSSNFTVEKKHFKRVRYLHVFLAGGLFLVVFLEHILLCARILPALAACLRVRKLPNALQLCSHGEVAVEKMSSAILRWHRLSFRGVIGEMVFASA